MEFRRALPVLCLPFGQASVEDIEVSGDRDNAKSLASFNIKQLEFK